MYINTIPLVFYIIFIRKLCNCYKDIVSLLWYTYFTLYYCIESIIWPSTGYMSVFMVIFPTVFPILHISHCCSLHGSLMREYLPVTPRATVQQEFKSLHAEQQINWSKLTCLFLAMEYSHIWYWLVKQCVQFQTCSKRFMYMYFSPFLNELWHWRYIFSKVALVKCHYFNEFTFFLSLDLSRAPREHSDPMKSSLVKVACWTQSLTYPFHYRYVHVYPLHLTLSNEHYRYKVYTPPPNTHQMNITCMYTPPSNTIQLTLQVCTPPPPNTHQINITCMYMYTPST